MAYSYNDFVTAATSAGLLNRFSEEDLKIAQSNPEYGLSALKLTQDLQGATTTEQRLLAQEALNQLKRTYGSFGPLPSGNGTSQGGTTVYQQALQEAQGGSFAYGGDTARKELLESVTNPPSFQYDPAQDPSYTALRKSYLLEGERAREDTLAKTAAAMGGVPSSYAVTAAQQSGDYYNGQLAEQIPALEQNAYQRYLSEQTLKQNALAALENDRNFDYSAYLQEQEQKQQELSNAMALYQLLGEKAPDWVKTVLGIAVEKAPSNVGSGNGSYVPPTPSTEETADNWGTGISNAGTGSSGGVTGSAWALTKNNLAGLLRNGEYAKAEAYVGQIAEQLSESQYREIEEMLRSAGYGG